MISEKCVRGVLARASGLCSADFDMSALAVRAVGAGVQATALDAGSLRVRGIAITSVDSVRRNLFGCSDRDENRRFLEKELAHQLEMDSQRWGFDFANEKPLPGTQRFAWDLVPASAVPQALRRAPVAPKPAPAPRSPVRSPEANKTQKRITDFLKPRKRLSGAGKKSPGSESRPPKLARLPARPRSHARPPRS